MRGAFLAAQLTDKARRTEVIGFDAKSERFAPLAPLLNITKAARRRVLNPGEPEEDVPKVESRRVRRMLFIQASVLFNAFYIKPEGLTIEHGPPPYDGVLHNGAPFNSAPFNGAVCIMVRHLMVR